MYANDLSEVVSMTPKPETPEKWEWEKELDLTIGSDWIRSNYLDCPCCGRKKHRIKENDLQVKDLASYLAIKYP